MRTRWQFAKLTKLLHFLKHTEVIRRSRLLVADWPLAAPSCGSWKVRARPRGRPWYLEPASHFSGALEDQLGLVLTLGRASKGGAG